ADPLRPPPVGPRGPGAADPRIGHRGIRRAAEERGPAVSGNDGRMAGGELGQAERSAREPGVRGRTAGQFTATHACLTGPQLDRVQVQAEVGGYAVTDRIAATCQAPAGCE